MSAAWAFGGDTPVATIDFASTSPILTEKQTAGEPQWLRVWSRDGGSGDPLNLMRVMPPKGARVRCRTGDFSHAISAHGIMNRINQEPRKPGKEVLVGFTSWLPGFEIFSYGLN